MWTGINWPITNESSDEPLGSGGGWSCVFAQGRLQNLGAGEFQSNWAACFTADKLVL
jgi:hypothetical protein